MDLGRPNYSLRLTSLQAMATGLGLPKHNIRFYTLPPLATSVSCAARSRVWSLLPSGVLY